ncbi:PAM68 [Auxenochlorella protothecoides x Auxenochlorella symbiontica]
MIPMERCCQHAWATRGLVRGPRAGPNGLSLPRLSPRTHARPAASKRPGPTKDEVRAMAGAQVREFVLDSLPISCSWQEHRPEREVPLGKAGGLKKVAVTRPIGSPPPDEAEDTSRLAVPQEVTDRMLRRILTFAGLPVAVSILFLPLFYFLKVTQGFEIPLPAVYFIQSLGFGGGLFGISYGILSASWDPSRPGSTLGANEFQANLPILLEYLRRK